MNTGNYKARIADELLKIKLKSSATVLVQGPKWCGKTTTSEQVASSILYMADLDTIKKNLLLAETNIKSLLDGNIPRLIDE